MTFRRRWFGEVWNKIFEVLYSSICKLPVNRDLPQAGRRLRAKLRDKAALDENQ
jgi:hypothetical protein